MTFKKKTNGDKQVAKTGNGGELQISAADLAADARMGGTVGLSDISIPFIAILQGLSPQVSPDHPKYVQGAQAGMLYVSVLEHVVDGRTEGLKIVPCFYERQLVEWKPIEKGGGLVRTYPMGDAIADQVKFNEKNQPMLPNGNQLYDTAYWYVLVDINGVWKQAVLPFKATFMKVSKKWNTDLVSTYVPGSQPPQQAPRWLYEWQLTSIKQQKDNLIWSIPQVKKGRTVSREVYDAAKQFCQIASQGILRGAVAAGETSQAAQGAKAFNDANLPF